jgi:hypothetical protein
MAGTMRGLLVGALFFGVRAIAFAHGPYSADGGVSSFYVWTGALTASPGTLLRHEPLDERLALTKAARSERILYVSTDGAGVAVKTAVSGSVYLPAGKPPSAGWPVVAWAHGTVGIADVCAPSWHGWLGRDRAYLNAWLDRGFAVVASDYQGLGTPGMHPYLNWRSEAYGILDAVRAARGTFGLDNRVVIVGQSQGSGAALGAGFAAPDYAPDVNVRGVVATGLVVNLAVPVAGASQVPVPPYAGGSADDAAYSMLYLLGVDQLLDRSLDVDTYVSPQGDDLLHAALTACLTDVVKVATAEKLSPQTAFTPARVSLVPVEDANLIFPSARFRVPVFTGTGLADSVAGTAPQYNFIADLCAAGTQVSWHFYPGLTHNGTVNASLVDSVPFVDAVMNGQPVASNCATLTAPGPLQTATPGVPFNH